jgi:hypothetical protein
MHDHSADKFYKDGWKDIRDLRGMKLSEVTKKEGSEHPFIVLSQPAKSHKEQLSGLSRTG